MRAWYLLVAGLLGLPWLIGCGPSRERANAMRQQIAIAETAYLEGVRALDQRDFETAARSWDDLYLVTRYPDKDVVELLVDGRTAMMTAEAMQRRFREEIEHRLGMWRQAYLSSRLELRRLDAFLLHVDWEDWEATRTDWQEVASKQAANQLYLKFAGEPLLPGLREALQGWLVDQAGGELHTGYGLGEEVPRRGVVTLEVAAEWLEWTTPTGGVLGRAPRSYTFSVQSAPSPDWLPQQAFSLSIAEQNIPTDRVYEDRKAGYAALAEFRDEADRQLAQQVIETLDRTDP